MINAYPFKAIPAHDSTTDDSVGITEIVLPHCNGLSVVMPTLAHLSRQTADRWFTWMPPRGVTKGLLQSYGFDLNRIRLIHPTNEAQAFQLLWDALAQGNSQTVVASPGRLTEKQIGQLELASQKGRCTGMLIRYR